MAIAKQLEALKRGREKMAKERAKAKKTVRKEIAKTKKSIKKATSKTVSRARKSIAKTTTKALNATTKRLKKKGLAGVKDKYCYETYSRSGYVTSSGSEPTRAKALKICKDIKNDNGCFSYRIWEKKLSVERMTEEEKNKLWKAVSSAANIASECKATDKDDVRFVNGIFKQLDNIADKIVRYKVTPVKLIF